MRKERLGSLPVQSKEPVIERITQLVRKHPSRSAAARAWGVNINTLNSYYKKEVDPPMPRENLLSRIAEREGVSLDWLINGTTESPKTPIKSSLGDNRDSLVEMLGFLTNTEREQLTAMLARKGVETILYLLDEDNIRLLKLDRVVKEKILGIQPRNLAGSELNDAQARECDSDNFREDGNKSLASNHKQAG